MLNDKLARHLGGSTRVVRLSEDTAAKQVKHRVGQNFDASHYALVQRAIDGGLWFESGKNSVAGYVEISPTKWLKAVLKRDAPGQRLYLVTLHSRSHALAGISVAVAV